MIKMDVAHHPCVKMLAHLSIGSLCKLVEVAFVSILAWHSLPPEYGTQSGIAASNFCM
jgi:hypothetical protein